MTKIYDFGEEEGSAFIVSEFVPGETLEEVLARKKKLPATEVLKIAKEVSEILSRIHKQGILHRDIKPSNIILKEDGHLKLTDFGLAQSFRIEKLTLEGEIIGTPAYMSPEQIAGKEVDFRSDIFSLGVVLLELMTGENPFLASTFTGVLHKILYEKTDLSCLPKEVGNLLSCLLAKDPNKRFSSAEEVSQAISLILKEPVSAPFLPQQIFRFLWRKALFLFIIFTSFFVSLLFFLLERREVSSRAEREKKIPLEIIEPEAGKILPKELAEAKKEPATVASARDEGEKKRKPSLTPLSPPGGKVDSGYLRLQVEPWADIYFGANYLGQTPFAFPIKLPPGKIKIKFNHQEFGAIEKEIEISPNETTHLFFDFKTVLGGLRIIAEPWARVYLDGKDKGETPMGIIYLPPGLHELKLLNPEFPPYQETLELKPGEIIERRIKW